MPVEPPVSLQNLSADLSQNKIYKDIIDLIYPVGAVLIRCIDDDPGDTYTWQTWNRVAHGRTLVTYDPNNVDTEIAYKGKVGEYSSRAESLLVEKDLPRIDPQFKTSTGGINHDDSKEESGIYKWSTSSADTGVDQSSGWMEPIGAEDEASQGTIPFPPYFSTAIFFREK